MQQRNSVLCLSSKANTQIKRDRKNRLTRKSVLKMLAVMEASQNAPGPSNSNQVPASTPEEAAANEKDFHSSGRTGRRNALPDILKPDPDSEESDQTEKTESKEEKQESPTENPDDNKTEKDKD